MALEIKIFGAPVQVGSFTFFDLMDEAAQTTRGTADVVAFQAKSAATSPSVTTDGTFKTAA